MKLKHIIFIILGILSFSLVLLVGVLNYNVESVNNLILNFHSFSIVIYIAIIAFAAATTLPINVTLIVGIFLFSFSEALLYAFLGVYLGSLVIYIISIYAGRGILKDYAKSRSKMKALDDLLHENKMSIVMLFNFVYFFPSNLAHIVAGYTKLDFWRFSFATITGNFPNIFGLALIIIGVSIPNYYYLASGLAILFFMTAIPLYIYRKHMRDILILAFSYKTYIKIKRAERLLKNKK